MILPAARAAIVTTLQAHAGLTGVQILGHPPGESQELREAIWIESALSRYEWRTLGGPAHWPRNRTEDLEMVLRVQVYREGPNQRIVADAAMDRLEALIAAVEDAIEVDPSLGAVVTHGRVAEVELVDRPAEAGWIAAGRVRFDATDYPT